MRKLLFLIALLTAIPAVAQVPVSLSPVAKQQFFDTTGKPLAGGALFTFIAGSTTQQPTYTESTGTVAYSNPIILDSGGFIPGPLFLIGNGYKFVLCAANTGTLGTGTCSTFGPQQWVVDNILLPPFLGGNNIWTGLNTFSGNTIFNGTVTMNAGGSLNGTFTGSPTFSGTPIFSTGMTVTGGTFNGPTINNMIVPTTGIVSNLNPDRQSILIPNNAVAPVLNELVKLTGAPSTATSTLAGDVGGAIGICTANCTNSGSATVQVNGLVNCVFSAGTTAGDFVVFSATAGNCLDVGGGGYPSSGQVLGKVLSTNAGAGTYQIDLFPADIRSPSTSAINFPQVVYNTPSASTNASIPTTTMITVGASNATYRFSISYSLTVLGVGCGNTSNVQRNLIYQDPVAPLTTTQTGLNQQSNPGTFNGVLGPWGVTAGIDNQEFRAKAGTVIQYNISFTPNGACAPAPQFQAFPILEQLTSN